MDPSEIDPSLLSSIPALPPPPGVRSNFVDPPSQANLLRNFIYTSMPLMLVFVLMRICTRLRIAREFGADDYVCIATAIAVCVFCSMYISMLGDPYGIHQWDVPASKVFNERWLKINIAAGIALYGASAIYMIWGGIVIILSFYTITCLVSVAYCVPKSGKSWLSLPTLPLCTKMMFDTSSIRGVFSAVSDIYVLCIPTHLVLGLRLQRGRKIGVCAIFLTGLVASAFSIVTSVYSFRNAASKDSTWEGATCYAFGAAELNVGIMCSCMPVVFVLLKGFAVKVSSSYPVRYMRSRQRRDGGSSEKNLSGDISSCQHLLAVPKGTLSGLGTFMRNAGRTRPSKPTSTEPLGSFTELKTIEEDLDYHARLKKELADVRAEVRGVPAADARIGWAV